MTPPWPSPAYDSRDEAIVAAMALADDGDTITVHRKGCSVSRDEPCDCEPETVLVVAEGRA